MNMNFKFVALAFTVGIFSSRSCLAESCMPYAQEKVSNAIATPHKWDGPSEGPEAVLEKSIIFVASDLRNGGVYGVARGMSEAISNLDWKLRFIDGLGSEVRQGASIRKAIGFEPDAIVLGGIDANRHKEVLKLAERLGIVIVGWHATAFAGGSPEIGLYTNITTDPLAVAEVAALLAVVSAEGAAKVIIFTDPNYKIAVEKANAMAEAIQHCRGSEVLRIETLPLDKIAQEMPTTIKRLWRQYADQVTHILATNDLYIDFAIPSFESLLVKNEPIPINISAGDGSKAAYKRINNALFQLATVPEPLYQHGWQIVDELNRAFNAQAPSGYSGPVHIVTPENVQGLLSHDHTGIYDPKNGYRKAYMKIWKP